MSRTWSRAVIPTTTMTPPKNKASDPPTDLLEHLLSARLAERAARDQLRSRRTLAPIDGIHARLEDGRVVTLFAGNDYLGLTHHPSVIEAMRRSLENCGAGSGSAGLIGGYTTEHAEAERALAAWKGAQACVLLPSGYQANLAAVQTVAALAQKGGGDRGAASRAAGVRFLVDKLAHASLIDAVRAADLPYRIFPHNHLEKLRRLLGERADGELQVVVTESIFSMDGDAADLPGLAELKREHRFALLLDEAHATGVYGAAGQGYAAERGLPHLADVSVITLSKSMGLIGGAVCGSQAFCDALLNFGRAYIYSTGVPAFIAAGARAAIDVMRRQPERQSRLRRCAALVRSRLRAQGRHTVFGGDDSPIIPLIFGGETAALQASEALLSRGIFVPAVRPPSVAPNASRLRITLSSEHADAEVEHLIECLLAL